MSSLSGARKIRGDCVGSFHPEMNVSFPLKRIERPKRTWGKRQANESPVSHSSRRCILTDAGEILRIYFFRRDKSWKIRIG
jgi:hypothetical protein